MRPAFWLVLVLVTSTALAGCSNPKKANREAKEPEFEFPKLDMDEGTEVRYVAEPEWKPGYHFTYESSTAFEGDSWGGGYVGNSTGKEAYSFGPGPGLNYTVVAEEKDLGESRFVAVDNEPGMGGPRVLAFIPNHLEPLDAYVDSSCDSYHQSGQQCAAYLRVFGEPESAPPLDFPLRDRDPSKKVVDEVPFLPFGPVLVVTRVMGMKEVAGPSGSVQAVQIHQVFVANLTRAAAELAEQDSSMSKLNLTGDVGGTRDVFYAPSLLNVVLDVTTSHGDYNGSYVRDGQPRSFGESWRRWSSTRLTGATYEERAPMSLGELRNVLRSGGDVTTSRLEFELETSSYSVDVGAGEAVKITVTPGPDLNDSAVSIVVLNSGGLPAAGTHGLALAFTPSRAGPYLIMAYATDSQGRITRQYRSLYANYHLEAETRQCDPVAIEGFTGCPMVPLPMSPSIAFLSVMVAAGTPGVSTIGQGRIFVDPGNGQQVSSATTGGFGSLFIEAPYVDPDRPDWLLGYQPDPGVAESVQFFADIYAGPVPAFVYDAAMEYGTNHQMDDDGEEPCDDDCGG